MSNSLLRQSSGRNASNNKPKKGSYAALESNLEKLGFLDDSTSKKKSKKSSKPDKSRPLGFLTSSDTASFRTESRSSNRSGIGYTPSRTSGSRPSRGMAAILDIEHARKDKTFLGGECAVCEEQLELTLRGERILQLTCGHIAHEACFYEYLREFDSHSCPICNAPLSLDSSRGGSVPNIDILSNAVRQGTNPNGKQQDYAPSLNTQLPWDDRTVTEGSMRHTVASPAPQDGLARNPSFGRGSDRGGPMSEASHVRSNSNVTAGYSTSDFPEPQGVARRHDYDLQSMETSVTNSRGAVANPIPAPTVTVRSEFPTLSRSRQQQSLTCLVTVEVGEPNWQPGHGDGNLLSPGAASEFGGLRSPPPPPPSYVATMQETPEELERITDELQHRVENWHGLDITRFGKLKLHGHIRVGKDRRAWQELDCYLFSDMLICVKERKATYNADDRGDEPRRPKCTLKGSILIKKHLQSVETSAEDNMLTLTLSVSELPAFYLQYRNRALLETWKAALLRISNAQALSPTRPGDYDLDSPDEDEYRLGRNQRLSSANSSHGASKSYATAPTEYSNPRIPTYTTSVPQAPHVPLDIIVVIPVSSSMQGLKITLLRDALRFLVANLGEKDRMGLVTFGSSTGGMAVVGMTGKAWNGWPKTLESIRPVGQKSLRADVVDGANVAMDLLMQRKFANPLASILLISDSSTSDPESVDFVVQRAEAAKVVIHSFGLGLTHKPDTMIELSTRTKASYTYVKDWMMLRECLAGVFGSLQSTSHQNVKLKLRLPEGSPAKFVKISGALHYTKRATGKDAEAALGDMRYGDKRDVLVQLVIESDTTTNEQLPHDPWESIVSGLEALGGTDQDESRTLSVEEVPLIQADLVYGDLQKDGAVAQLPRPSLLAITMLPISTRAAKSPSAAGGIARPASPPIPPHPSVVQRRMELLTSDMLTRALTLVSRGQHERAQHLLTETRSILKGLGKGGLPPLPPPPAQNGVSSRSPGGHGQGVGGTSPTSSHGGADAPDRLDVAGHQQRTPSPPQHPQAHAPPPLPLPLPHAMSPASPGAASALSAPGPASASSTGNFPPSSASGPGGAASNATLIDGRTVAALESELESSLEWIGHPAVFGRDSRKAVLQAIGVISSQRAYTFRTPIEALWAERVGGVRRMAERAREWREVANREGLGDPTVLEES